MRVSLTILIVLLSVQSQLWGQTARTYHLKASGTNGALPPSNSASDIFVERDTVWFGTDNGLSQSIDGGLTFRNFANSPPFDSKGTSALAMNDRIIWVAVATTFTQDNQSLPQGSGLDFSTDRGATWNYVLQPVDTGLVDTIQYGINRIKALDVTTTVNNITYDLAVTSSTVWTANFAGMLRKSTDDGASWQRVVLPPDSGADFISPTETLNFDLSPTSGKAGLNQNLNHRVFSVYASNDSTLWVGTAGGINLSTDGGISWRKFSHQNQAQPISGNFVVAINEQRVGSIRVIWAATVNAEASDEQRGVSFSFDQGSTWKTTLLGEFAHNIAFMDSIVYVATDDGIFRTSDYGNSWIRSGSIRDRNNLQQFTSSQIYAVASEGDTVWVGGPDGIAFTMDSPSSPFGSEWRVFRTYAPVGNTSKTYSYPLPFSPNQGAVRIHYSLQGRSAPVTIRIFDFAMHPVKTLLQNAIRSSSMEHDEIWNGFDDQNRRVANGVYFYSVQIGGLDPVWGKILVVQ
jgi:photosystem II stability/assembly factor-like uncharacterized protein